MDKDDDSQIVSALGSAISVFAQAGAYAVGGSLIAYGLGWRAADCYYAKFGATWLTTDLRPMELLSFMGGWILFVVLTIIYSIGKLAAGEYTVRGLTKASTATSGFGFLFWLVAFVGLPTEAEHPLLVLAEYYIGGMLWGYSISADICVIANALRLNDFQWRSKQILELHFIAALALFFSPLCIGSYKAVAARWPATSDLPRVILEDSQSWRLLRVTGDNLVLADLGTPSPLPPLKIIKATDARIIETVANP